MSNELSELSDLHMAYEGAADPDYFGDHPGDAEAAELSAAVGRYLAAREYAACTSGDVEKLTLKDRLAILLSEYDENGLRPTDAALDVLMAVVRAIDEVDEDGSRDESFVPIAWAYAKHAERTLARLRAEQEPAKGLRP